MTRYSHLIEPYLSGRLYDDANHLGIVDNAEKNSQKMPSLEVLSGLIQTVFLLKIYEFKL